MAVTSIVFTKVGRQWIVDKTDGTSALPMKFIGSGTGTTAAADTDTALGTEVESRATGTQTQVNVNGTTGDGSQTVGTVTYTATRAITESALFDASSSGNMGFRAVFDAINVANGDGIQFTWVWAAT
jgi:hypothetical protein